MMRNALCAYISQVVKRVNAWRIKALHINACKIHVIIFNRK